MRKSYDTQRRNITLFKGEAWIRVGVDSHRPFAVDVGSVRIKDVGTEFTVRTEPQETIVYVIQGRVQLRINSAQNASVIELGRNEEAVIVTDSEHKTRLQYKHTLTPGEANKKLAWTTGKMVLTGEPLGDVVREINRYHRKQLVITDTVLEQIKVGGIIDPAANDYRVIVRALGSDCPIAIDDSDPAFVRLAIDQVNGVCKNRRGGHVVDRN